MAEVRFDIPLHLPCGSMAAFDYSSGCSHRCTKCFATVGSMAMPKLCKDEADKWDAWERLGGEGWDYINGSKEKYTAD